MVSYELYNNLLCRNVIVEFDDKYFENVYSEVLLSLAHGHLKQLLSSHGIVFGKFWKGEQASDRHGNTVAPTPYNFISIRSAQREYDLRFFQSPGKARDDFLRWKYSNQDRNLKFETDIALARSSVCEYLDSMEKEMRSKRVLH